MTHIGLTNPRKWTHFGALSTTLGVKLFHDLKNIVDVTRYIIFDMEHRHHAATSYTK